MYLIRSFSITSRSQTIKLFVNPSQSRPIKISRPEFYFSFYTIPNVFVQRYRYGFYNNFNVKFLHASRTCAAVYCWDDDARNYSGINYNFAITLSPTSGLHQETTIMWQFNVMLQRICSILLITQAYWRLLNTFTDKKHYETGLFIHYPFCCTFTPLSIIPHWKLLIWILRQEYSKTTAFVSLWFGVVVWMSPKTIIL